MHAQTDVLPLWHHVVSMMISEQVVIFRCCIFVVTESRSITSNALFTLTRVWQCGNGRIWSSETTPLSPTSPTCPKSGVRDQSFGIFVFVQRVRNKGRVTLREISAIQSARNSFRFTAHAVPDVGALWHLVTFCWRGHCGSHLVSCDHVFGVFSLGISDMKLRLFTVPDLQLYSFWPTPFGGSERFQAKEPWQERVLAKSVVYN